MMHIEKGCQAIIINLKKSSGTTVIIGNYLGKVSGYVGNNRWEIDKTLPTKKGNTCNHCQEKNLMRIDDYKEETKLEKAETI